MKNQLSSRVIDFDPKADDVLLHAARGGDQQAFGILVERYQPKIYAVALRYARVREDAEDIVQQTFKSAFVHLHRFEGKSSFCTWLTRIAINEALMLLRRVRARRETPIDNANETETAPSAFDIRDSSPDPEAGYLQRERIDLLSAAIEKLPPPLRAAIKLREVGELSTQETARRMALSVAAVKARVFHGRRKLRKRLTNFEITLNVQKLHFNN
jgi:RNA polymerase sigma-70 factor (ECF subfamily)